MLHYESLAKVTIILAPGVVHGNKGLRRIKTGEAQEGLEATRVTIKGSNIVNATMNDNPATSIMIMGSHCKLLPVQTKGKVEELPIANRHQLCLLAQELFMIRNLLFLDPPPRG